MAYHQESHILTFFMLLKHLSTTTTLQGDIINQNPQSWQVSNWFINARVRLWKPMVEEIYQQEAKDKEAEGNKDRRETRPQSPSHHNSPLGQGPEANRPQSPAVATAHQLSNDDTILIGTDAPTSAVDLCGADMEPMDDLCGAAAATALGSSVRLGASGDVSLTLGLRHSGNPSEKHWFYG